MGLKESSGFQITSPGDQPPAYEEMTGEHLPEADKQLPEAPQDPFPEGDEDIYLDADEPDEEDDA